MTCQQKDNEIYFSAFLLINITSGCLSVLSGKHLKDIEHLGLKQRYKQHRSKQFVVYELPTKRFYWQKRYKAFSLIQCAFAFVESRVNFAEYESHHVLLCLFN